MRELFEAIAELSVFLGWIAKQLHRAVKVAEPWGILFVVVGLWFTFEQLQDSRSALEEDRVARAWQIVASDAPGNSGKIWALEYLVQSQQEPLPGLDLAPRTGEIGAFLRGVDLAGADLPNADLRGADLTGANFRDANLADANFEGATLHGADFTGAQITYVNFGDVKGSVIGLDHDSFGIDTIYYCREDYEFNFKPAITSFPDTETLSEAAAIWSAPTQLFGFDPYLSINRVRPDEFALEYDDYEISWYELSWALCDENRRITRSDRLRLQFDIINSILQRITEEPNND